MTQSVAKNLALLFAVFLAAFLIVTVSAPRVIPALRRLKFGQQVRDNGPQSHLKKQGTPTMGGVMLLFAFLLVGIVLLVLKKEAAGSLLPVLFLTITFGLTGFADDYLKIRRKNSDGLKPKQKLFFQLLCAVIFTVWVYRNPSGISAGGRVYLPFTGIGDNAVYAELPLWAFLPFSVFVILGTDNGVNFTDGLDGLCSSVTSVVCVFFLTAGFFYSEGVALSAAICLGALLGFLMYNAYPAAIFMGDTGSLALGGFVAACAVMTGTEIYILLFGFIYLCEVLSVILQVGYYKKTHGKRLFKMAPIHHHFELCGKSETQIVAAFTIVTAILTFLSICGIFAGR